MAKKRSKRRQSASAARRKRQSSSQRSWTIPIVVGVIVVTVAAAALISLQRRQSPVAAGASDPVETAQPLPVQSIPYPIVPRIGLDETQEKLEQGQAVLVDVRSRASYDKSHAAGAFSVPEEEIDGRLGELPRDKDLVLY